MRVQICLLTGAHGAPPQLLGSGSSHLRAPGLDTTKEVQDPQTSLNTC